MDCIFCKIINKEIPADFIYEDERLVVFLNIKPINPGHSLVVPREHHENLLDTPPETLAAIAIKIPELAKGICAATGAAGFNLGVNNGAAAGQLVMHSHWHIIPRHADDGLEHWGSKAVLAADMKELAEKIRTALV